MQIWWWAQLLPRARVHGRPALCWSSSHFTGYFLNDNHPLRTRASHSSTPKAIYPVACSHVISWSAVRRNAGTSRQGKARPYCGTRCRGTGEFLLTKSVTQVAQHFHPERKVQLITNSFAPKSMCRLIVLLHKAGYPYPSCPSSIHHVVSGSRYEQHSSSETPQPWPGE